MDELLKGDIPVTEETANSAEAAAEAVSEVAEAVTETAETAVETAAEAAAEAVAEAVAETAETAAETVAEAAEAAAETVSETAKADAPMSMDDLKDELEASFRQIHEGDTLTGKVIGVSETEILVDFNYYAPGVIRLEDASDDPTFSIKNRIEEGQTLTSTVLRRDDGAGRILLSMKEAATAMAWDRLRELKETQGNVTVKISGVTKAGAIAYLEGIRGFIPASRLALTYVEEDDLPNWIGKSLDARVIEAEQAASKLILSAREILREKAAQERQNRITGVQVGLVTEGKVETIKPYGAFIDLGNGLSGLLHISQISQKRIKHPSALLQEGQTVKVKVIDNKDGKLSLSMKALEDIMAEEAVEETIELPTSEAVGTSLASLLSKLKL